MLILVFSNCFATKSKEKMFKKWKYLARSLMLVSKVTLASWKKYIGIIQGSARAALGTKKISLFASIATIISFFLLIISTGLVVIKALAAL